jgi:hypothetical protein
VENTFDLLVISLLRIFDQGFEVKNERDRPHVLRSPYAPSRLQAESG